MKTLEPGDHRHASRVLAAAFADDPFMLWLTRGKMDHSDLAYLAIVKLFRHHGHSYLSDDGTGVALWSPPGVTKFKTSTALRIAPLMLRSLGISGARRGDQADKFTRPRHPDEPHWYLSMLGVDPASQRSGVGRSLLEPMLERAASEGRIVHLETAKATNVPYYESHGFTVTDHVEIPDGGPPIWFMQRRP